MPALATDVGIGIFTYEDCNCGLTDNDFSFMISGFNKESVAQPVDVHVGLIAEDGTIYEYPDFNTNLTPWLPNFQLPASFSYPPTLTGDLTQFPGGLKPGVYHLAAALTEPGTLNLLAMNTRVIKVIANQTGFTLAKVFFGREQRYDATGDTDPALYVLASGIFEQYAGSTTNLVDDQSNTATLEQCVFSSETIADVAPDIGSATYLDAGTSLQLIPAGKQAITLEAYPHQSGMLYSQTLSDSDYQDDTTYRFTGSGGVSFPAFDISAKAPPRIVLNSPNLDQLKYLDTSRDLPVQWTARNGVDEISVCLTATATDKTISVSCRFEDDGQATIPATLLTQYHQAISNLGDESYEQRLQINRLASEKQSVSNGQVVEFGISELLTIIINTL
jgi:hypothetical protein